MKLSGITLSINKIAQVQAKIALQIPQTIEERETYLVLKSVMKYVNTPKQLNVHVVVMVMPRYVEAALPPLKPVNNGKMLPKRAPIHVNQ